MKGVAGRDVDFLKASTLSHCTSRKILCVVDGMVEEVDASPPSHAHTHRAVYKTWTLAGLVMVPGIKNFVM